jgi:hypothetical protein
MDADVNETLSVFSVQPKDIGNIYPSADCRQRESQLRSVVMENGFPPHRGVRASRWALTRCVEVENIANQTAQQPLTVLDRSVIADEGAPGHAGRLRGRKEKE